MVMRRKMNEKIGSDFSMVEYVRIPPRASSMPSPRPLSPDHTTRDVRRSLGAVRKTPDGGGSGGWERMIWNGCDRICPAGRQTLESGLGGEYQSPAGHRRRQRENALETVGVATRPNARTARRTRTQQARIDRDVAGRMPWVMRGLSAARIRAGWRSRHDAIAAGDAPR